MLCLARALLRPFQILICDEATAHVDLETDRILHQILFQLDCCVISICHKLESIHQYDTVVVLDQGQVVEHGTFRQLVQRQGVFSQMYSQTQQNSTF